MPSPVQGDMDEPVSVLPLEEESQKSNQYDRNLRFWMIFLCITASQFITALELAAVTTALPTIVETLHGEQFIWVGSAYTIATTAFIPLSGNVAQIFGRRLTMLVSIAVFAVGSALCGAATTLNFLIGGRVVQGIGSGGIQAMCHVILSDMIPLKDRGTFNGFLAMSYTVASGVGPVVGGALAQHGQWRWLFYLNLPVCGAVAVLVLVFLKLRTPSGSVREKLARIDWIGNVIVMASTTAVMIGLTWGGVQYAWQSWHILVPLIIGLCGLVAFLVFEAFIPQTPIVSYHLLSTRTSASGYFQTLINYTIITGMLFYLPVYFQACKDASPTASGVDIFGMAFSIAPMAVIGGISITKSNYYRPQMWVAWCLIVVGTGLLSTTRADTSRIRIIGFEILTGVGSGLVASGVYFPILAPLSVEFNGPALALFMFCRNFANILGVTIGGTVLQNELKKRLPSGFEQVFEGSTAIAYSIIPLVKSLEDPLKTEVQIAFADSVRVVWQVLIGIAGLGFLCSLPMRHLPLHTKVDEKWGLEDNANGRDPVHELEEQKPGEILAVAGRTSSSQSTVSNK